MESSAPTTRGKAPAATVTHPVAASVFISTTACSSPRSFLLSRKCADLSSARKQCEIGKPHCPFKTKDKCKLVYFNFKTNPKFCTDPARCCSPGAGECPGFRVCCPVVGGQCGVPQFGGHCAMKC